MQNGTNYIKFRFLENVPNDLIFEYGEVIPWFGRQGLGDQIKSSQSLFELYEQGIIEIIERKEFINSQWNPL